jgi:hypothetical protein
MTTLDLKAGDKITDLRFDLVYYISSITEKRINMNDNVKFTTSTGRTTSSFYLGHKSFEVLLKNGSYKIN